MSRFRETSDRRRAPARRFGGAFDRLTVRLAVGITLLVVGPLTAGLYVLSQRQYAQGIELRRRAAESENRILEAALRHRMMVRDSALLEDILREIASDPEVRDVMIVDHDGEVRIASDPARVGTLLSKDSSTCLVCHDRAPTKRERWTLLETGAGRVLRTVQPIENRSECHACHDPDEEYNGMLLFDISLNQLEAQLDRDRAGILIGAGLLGLTLLGGMGLLVRSLILKRLVRVGQTARSITAGNLSERVPTNGDDVISTLARDFNDMASSVSELILEVQQQEAQLSSVMNSLDDGLVVLDREGRIVACNSSFSRRVGATSETLQTLPCHEAAGRALPCCESKQECPASRCATTGEVQRATFRVSTSAGETQRVDEVYASPVLDGDRQVVQVVEVWRDITERVKEEEHLAEIERLVSLGVLASGFSHEVNTPLASILTSADSVVGRIDDCARGDAPADLLPSIRESAEIVREQVLRCRKITEEFLRFSRGVPPSVDPIDLGAHVAEIVSLARPTARENNVELRCDAPPALPSVSANAELVKHVVLNLLINAIQSCTAGGGTVEVSFVIDGDTRVRVRDSGSGIRPEDRRHLFEPFRSRKPQGTGLGLFLSRRFMRRFGGDVRLFETEVGKGSCFEIVFNRLTEAG